MPNILELDGTPRRALHVFYVLDTSRSMEGRWIAALNEAMGETTEVLKKKAEKNADALLKIAVLEFNSGCEWIQPLGPEDLEDFIWSDLSAGGLTDMGEALKELDSKLSRDQFLSSSTGAYLPIIIFMTDGFATDNYKKALQQIRRNKWFAHAVKIGLALGDYPDIAMIAEIVGSVEAVVATSNLEVFERLVQFLSQTSAVLCSSSSTEQDRVTGSDIVKRAVREGVAPKEAVDINIPNLPKPPVPGYDIRDEDIDEWDDDFF